MEIGVVKNHLKAIPMSLSIVAAAAVSRIYSLTTNACPVAR